MARNAMPTHGEPETQDKRCPHQSQACGRGGLCGPTKQSRRPSLKNHPPYPITYTSTGSRTSLLNTRGHPDPARENYHPGGMTKARARPLSALTRSGRSYFSTRQAKLSKGPRGPQVQALQSGRGGEYENKKGYERQETKDKTHSGRTN